MRRRFGRGRRGGGAGDGRGAEIDAARWVERIAEAGVVRAASLEPAEADDVPAGFAGIATGATESGEPLALGFAPRGGDALLAALAHAARLAGDGSFAGEVVAVAPEWTIAARRRLALATRVPFRFRAVACPSLGDDGADIALEPASLAMVTPAEAVAAQLESAADRELFERALSAFEGLAAKHGGVVRGTGAGVELVLLARVAASLRATGGRVVLEALLPDRATQGLTAGGLAAALDRLEGGLRKRLNDRRVRSGDEGLRAELAPRLVAEAGLRAARLWPLPGSDPEVLDVLGIEAAGRPVVGVVRDRLTLPVLGPILDAALEVQPWLPVLLAGAPPPLRFEAPGLTLAAASFDEAALLAIAALGVDARLFDVRSPRGRDRELVARTPTAAVAAAPTAAVAAAPGAAVAAEPGAAVAAEPGAAAGRAREPRRSEPQRARAPRAPAARAEGGPKPEPAASGDLEAEGSRFEEISLFDLDDETRAGSGDGEAEEAEPRRRRRGRRRRGRRGSAAAGEARETAAGEAHEPAAEPVSEAEERDAPEPGRRRERRSGAGRARRPTPVDDDEPALLDDEVDEKLAALAPIDESVEIPDVEEVIPAYEEDEEEPADEIEEVDRAAQEREARRRARLAKAAPAPEAPEPPKRPRKRSALVVHADRDSVGAAVLLARDIRLVEGFWVYSQAELMTFFRSVATDLRPDTPIYVVGFTASPAREVLQAAALYSGRLSWFDHHEWPPEDLEAMRAAIGAENVVVQPGSDSSLPAVLADRTRRSRFSDKLVELLTGKFSDHDYERWGRLWWHRLGELASESGERRTRIDPLLAGRPSDLAREASRAPRPAVPAEVQYVSQRDFRLVHFGGYMLTVVPVPPGLDPHLTARVARERFAADVSLSFVEGQETLILASDEARGRRSLDMGAMVRHLAAKHDWIEALRDEDYVARIRARGLAEHSERLDEVIGEIAMGRSILEG
jgi:hypothetical protein